MNSPLNAVSVAKITSNGQISLPAEIRRRWGVGRVSIMDRGDLAIVRALPDDPIAHYRGRFKRTGDPSTDELRELEREAEQRAEAAKLTLHSPS
jgi:bifunctional DNA-binding transcriptional regulator/antitoxin component of YhaV-PrlF toxin-antitoxin module